MLYGARGLRVYGLCPSPVRTPTLTLFPLPSSPTVSTLQVVWLSQECPLLAGVINCQTRGLKQLLFTGRDWSGESSPAEGLGVTYTLSGHPYQALQFGRLDRVVAAHQYTPLRKAYQVVSLGRLDAV